MRLIDADAMKADIEKFNRPLCDGYHMKDYVLNQIITDIENQPTVKAIPIEWLKRLQGRYLEAECNMSFCVVNEILNLWEKENESTRSDI